MKAILLSAGQGSRLRPLTDDRPKGMVELGGRSILERQIGQFRDQGVDDIVVVGGYCHQAIPDMSVVKRINHDYETTNMVYSLFCARDDILEAEEIVVSYGDIVYSDSVLAAVINAPNSINVVVDTNWYDYFSRRSDDVLSDAETLRMFDGSISEIGGVAESVDQIEAQYIGLMKFDRKATDALKDIFDTALDNGSEIGWGRPARKAYMTDLIQEAVNRGLGVSSVPISGGWCEIDTLADYELAEAMLPSIDV